MELREFCFSLREFIKSTGLGMSSKQANKKWNNLKDRYKVTWTTKKHHVLNKGVIWECEQIIIITE